MVVSLTESNYRKKLDCWRVGAFELHKINLAELALLKKMIFDGFVVTTSDVVVG